LSFAKWIFFDAPYLCIMLANLPIFITIFFALTTFATLFLFYGVVKNANLQSTQKFANPIFFCMSLWLAIQGFLTLKNVYNTDLNAMPPKIVLFGIAPTIITMVLLFATVKGKQFVDSLPLKNITYLNTIRIPVELVLFWLFLNKAVPQLMTFEGRNFDILAGISAPFVAYFAFSKEKISPKMLLAWNVFCLGLLANIVVLAFFSAPTPLQKFAFEQPNIGIINFPFSWLPTFIVPIVLFGHLTSIRQLLHYK
jgi:hypothetical protein